MDYIYYCSSQKHITVLGDTVAQRLLEQTAYGIYEKYCIQKRLLKKRTTLNVNNIKC